MKNNVVAALIIAVTMLAIAWMAQYETTGVVESGLAEIEKAAVEKDASGKSRIARITEGVAGSITQGIQSGFGFGGDEERRAELDIRDQQVISSVRLVPGATAREERVVGLIRNAGVYIVRAVSLNVVFKDDHGAVIDVATKETDVKGTLKPGDEFGFDVTRKLGDFSEDGAVLQRRRAATAVVKVVALDLVDEAGPP